MSDLRPNPSPPPPPGGRNQDVRSRLAELERSCKELLDEPYAPEASSSLPAQQLERLLEISRTMNQIHDRDELLSYVRDRLRELFDAENSFVILLDADQKPRIQSTNLEPEGRDTLPISETILKQVLETRSALRIDNAATNPELRNQSSVLRYKIASVLCAPLLVGDTVLGVLQFDQRGAPSPFTGDDLRLLSLFADHAATAFKNLELIERLHETVEEIRSAQASIVQATRLSALGETAAGIAHDFNNTLLVALGHCDLLLAREDIDAEARGAIQTIRTCALDAANTVRRMLTITRESEPEPPRKSVALDELVAELPQFTRHKWSDEAHHRGASIEVELDLQSDAFVTAAPSELREISMNLIFNAVDAIEERGTITLATGVRGGQAFISVADDGTGMDKATLARVFNPFFSTKGARGCGFGLSTCESIAKRLGGSIECTSTPGQGSCFTLWVPATSDKGAAAGEVRSGARRSYRLLIVDDDELVLHTVQRLLSTLGHDVATESDPLAALARARSETFDAILTDLGMPVITGTDLAQRVRAAGVETPIVLLTGWDAEDPDAHSAHGIDHVLNKPLTLASLEAGLESVLGDSARGPAS